MFRIHCPHCCETRSEEEFSYAGEAHIPRPVDPSSLSDAEWGAYLHARTNPRGLHREMWVHTAGCRRFFNVLRDTVSYEIVTVYLVGEMPPVRKQAP